MEDIQSEFCNVEAFVLENKRDIFMALARAEELFVEEEFNNKDEYALALATSAATLIYTDRGGEVPQSVEEVPENLSQLASHILFFKIINDNKEVLAEYSQYFYPEK